MSEGLVSGVAPRVLVVEDEPHVRRGLLDVLRFRGCAAEAVGDGAEALRRALAEPWDLIVLDVMLPELSGFSVCEQLRKAGAEVPVLMLTAKGDEDDIVRGFEAGANDYVTKPFGVRELSVRIDALLRRSARRVTEPFSVGALAVDPERAQAHAGDECFELTAREVRILRVFALAPERVVSRRTLLADAWDMSNAGAVETRTVDVHIAKLRKKLGAYGDCIATVRGHGYRLVP